MRRGRATKTKLVTQMGTQIHAGDNYRRVVELVQGGAIGPVTRGARLVVGKVVVAAATTRPRARRRCPKGLHWDLWLGPAPQRPYRTDIPARELAALVGLRQRHARRHGLPLHGPAVLGARPAPPDAASRPRARRSTPRRPPRLARSSTTTSPRAASSPPVTLTGTTATTQPAASKLVRVEPAQGLEERRAVRRREGHALRRLHAASACCPQDKFADFKAPPQVDPQLDRPPRGVDRRDQLNDRQPDDLQLRLHRRADRDGAARQRRVPRRQEARVGREEPQGDQRPRGRPSSSAASTARAGTWWWRSRRRAFDGSTVAGDRLSTRRLPPNHRQSGTPRYKPCNGRLSRFSTDQHPATNRSTPEP